MSLRGKTIVVTGAARGIGAACAVEMAGQGARLVCADIDDCYGTVARIIDIGGQARSHPVDVSDKESVSDLFASVAATEGDLDHVCNSAGVVLERSLLDMTQDEFDTVIRINLKGTFLVGQAALRRITAGSATFVASNLGYIGRADHSAYVASKHGVMGLVRSWAEEFAPAIRINALCPGPTSTRMLAADQLSDKWRAKELDLPLKRFADPAEIARAARFLASDDASYITGQGLGVNGGSVMA
ncbi:SDR family oxidoreductase [Mesorhizobium sp. KR9-304]|uniref:SDR family NAD(P)-dependent oxidoreductase n=1 Tax=Mesorhizobium sp. KR9-304 TaxID=3156614 RepID=UPI0032B5A47A